jgi:hypothetical protein
VHEKGKGWLNHNLRANRGEEEFFFIFIARNPLKRLDSQK